MEKGRHRPTRPAGLRGLKAQLMMLAVLASVPPLGAGAVGAWMALAAHEQAYKGRLHDGARGLALAVERELEVTLAALQALAASPALDEAEPGNLAPFYHHARRTAEQMGSPVLFVGPDLRLRLDTGEALDAPLPDGTLGSATRRTLETGRPGVSNLMAFDGARSPFIVVNVPVLRAGKVLGVVATRMEAVRLSRLLAASDLGGDVFFASVLDTRLLVAARSSGAERYTGHSVAASFRQSFHNRVSGEGEGRAMDGRDILFAFRAISNMPGWNVLVGVATEDYHAGRMRPMRVLGVAGGLAVALALLGIALFCRNVLRPLKALRLKAEAVSQGTGGGLAPPEQGGGIAEFAELWSGLTAAEQALRRQSVAERTATEALLASDRRHRSLAEAGAIAIWRADAEGNILESRGWEVLTGQGPQELRGAGWLKVVHPDDAAGAAGALQAAVRERRPLEMTYRVRQRSGAWLWLRCRGLPLFAEDGTLTEWVGVAEDVDARHQAEDRQRLLAREASHRAKNVLAVVQAVVRLTQASDTPQFIAAVEARIAALARAHALLAQEGWAGADLRAIAEREFAPYTTGRTATDHIRVRLEGPAATLAPRVVQPLAMVLHELATNAAKHGALSLPTGSLLLRWSLDHAAGTLVLEWEERGGPPVAAAPVARGFGARVIEATIRSQLRGQIERRWEAQGLSCRITLPAAQTLAAGDAAPSETAKGEAATGDAAAG